MNNIISKKHLLKMCAITGIVNLQGTTKKKQKVPSSNISNQVVSVKKETKESRVENVVKEEKFDDIFIGVMLDKKVISGENAVAVLKLLFDKLQFSNVPLLEISEKEIIYTSTDTLLSIFLIDCKSLKPLIIQLGLTIKSNDLITLSIIMLGMILQGLPKDHSLEGDNQAILAEINTLLKSYIVYMLKQNKTMNTEKLKELITGLFLKMYNDKSIKLIVRGESINKDILTKPLFVNIIINVILMYIKHISNIYLIKALTEISDEKFSKIATDEKNKQEKKDNSVFNENEEDKNPL